MDNRSGTIGTCANPFILFPLVILALTVLPDSARGNPDVYAALPEDARVIQYGLGDADGDSRQELAVFYTTGGEVRLTLFQAESGHWLPWWEDDGSLAGLEGSSPSSVEMVDVNGDGQDEVLTYYLTENSTAMVARILTLDTGDPGSPVADILLEDMTSPPGYPLFGTENGSPSVTFLKMPLENGDIGHQRVYCWDGNRFEKCVEVPWHRP